MAWVNNVNRFPEIAEAGSQLVQRTAWAVALAVSFAITQMASAEEAREILPTNYSSMQEAVRAAGDNFQVVRWNHGRHVFIPADKLQAFLTGVNTILATRGEEVFTTVTIGWDGVLRLFPAGSPFTETNPEIGLRDAWVSKLLQSLGINPWASEITIETPSRDNDNENRGVAPDVPTPDTGWDTGWDTGPVFQ